MVALDQRESLRTMLGGQAVPDHALAAFKVDAARALTPHASAVLVDVALGLRPVLNAGVLAQGCGLIVAADHLVQPQGGIVEDTAVDDAVFADPEVIARADAYKLLVIWRSGRDRARRTATVRAFVDACRHRHRPGIVEGIVRPEPGDHLAPDRHAALVVEAALELTEAAPDLYKAEIPSLGLANDEAITAAAMRVTDAIACPWVVLSNGVRPERFDDAAVAAARGGASGFLAGRAIWIESIGTEDPRAHLEGVAAPRLAALATRIDRVARPWSAA
jgi:sulfofructosephosphate aldolase